MNLNKHIAKQVANALEAQAPHIDWDVALLNQNSLSISASKAYLSVSYTLSVDKIQSELPKTVKQLAWLMNSVQ